MCVSSVCLVFLSLSLSGVKAQDLVSDVLVLWRDEIQKVYDLMLGLGVELKNIAEQGNNVAQMARVKGGEFAQQIPLLHLHIQQLYDTASEAMNNNIQAKRTLIANLTPYKDNLLYAALGTITAILQVTNETSDDLTNECLDKYAIEVNHSVERMNEAIGQTTAEDYILRNMLPGTSVEMDVASALEQLHL